MSKTRTENPFFTPEQRELIVGHILTGAPDFEIERFLITCERTGLDPFSRQIYGHVQNKKVKHDGKDVWVPTVVIVTSIDGFRAIAERSSQYRGQTSPEWYYVNDEGVSAWHDVFITPRDQRGNPMKVPDACRVGVLREGFQAPCYGVANFSSFAKYYRSEGEGFVLEAFWKKMPEHMIAKVAEAQAHRKAFPLLACGLFVEEEVQRAEEEEGLLPPGEAAPGEKVISIAPPAAPTPPPAAPVVVADEKPAEDTTPPLVADAEPKKARGKKAAAKTETPAPAAPPAEEEPAAPVGNSAPWRDHVISQITIGKYIGKKLSELSPADIGSLFNGWVVKYADKIKNNPAKVVEAEMIAVANADLNP